jgi:hypothetical protein
MFGRRKPTAQPPAPAIKPSVGKSPLDGLRNLPKMSGPLGSVGTPPAGGPKFENMPPPNMKQPGNPGFPGPQYTGPGAGPTGPANMAKINQLKSATQGKPMKTGGKVSSASKRGDGCAIKGKTKGRMV